jgi:uncharacterized protein
MMGHRKDAGQSGFAAGSPFAWLCAVAMAGVFLSALSMSANAQDANARVSEELGATSSAGYVNPFPEGDTYKVQVYGDSFAEGLLGGLVEAFNNEPRVSIAKKHKVVGALVRNDFEEDLKPEETSRDVVHIGVLMIGLNDRERLRPAGGGKALLFGTDDWQAEYGRRVDRWIKTLKKRNIALYVVGQPPLRRQDANRDAEGITEILREKSYLNGVRFIDLSEGFTDDGAFTQFGPDVTGNRVKLREGDGVSFTNGGNRKLAHYVEREMRRDITQAKTERNIPLAGADAEQRKINPGKVQGQGAQVVAANAKGAVAREARLAQAKSAVTPVVPAAVLDSSADQKADNAKLSLRLPGAGGKDETVLIDIARPAIPAAVIALVTRKEVTDRVSQISDLAPEEISGGLTLVNSISTAAEVGGNSARRRTAAGQSATFTVLVKGERLVPKPGRSDDFSWPKPEFADPVPASTVSARPGERPGERPAAVPKAPPAQPGKSSPRG